MNVRHPLTQLGIFAAGVVTGGAVALLMAPSSGDELRRQLAQRCRDGRQELKRRGQRAVESTARHIEHGIEDGKRRLNAALAT